MQPMNAKYKSKTCTTFNEKLYCPYGKRCLFKHDDRGVEQLERYTYVSKIQFFPEEYLNFDLNLVNPSNEVVRTMGGSHKRLPIFQ